MDRYLDRAEKVLARIDELATISEDQSALTRTFGTPAFLAGRDKVQSWMEQAGLETRIDNIGNARGRLPAGKASAKTFVIASHIDTVVNAGKWDGPLGVILGLDQLENLVNKKISIPFNIELIAFSDEEGVRFHSTFLGSKVVAGSFEDSLLEQRDEAGLTLKEVLAKMDCDVAGLKQDMIPANEWLGYLEIHIEQGPVLYERKIPVAIVSAIAGQNRIEVTFEGLAGHAGTVPMDMRKDALCCAADFITKAEKYGLENKDSLVVTVGKLHIPNAASNVIPGEVICSLDVRSADEKVLESATKFLHEMCLSVAGERKIKTAWRLIQHTGAVNCDEDLNRLLAQSIDESGEEVMTLVSGAGHDAVPVAAVAPVAILFVRCFEGISHNPLEDVELEDIRAAIEISEKFIQNLVKKYTQ